MPYRSTTPPTGIDDETIRRLRRCFYVTSADAKHVTLRVVPVGMKTKEDGQTAMRVTLIIVYAIFGIVILPFLWSTSPGPELVLLNGAIGLLPILGFRHLLRRMPRGKFTLTLFAADEVGLLSWAPWDERRRMTFVQGEGADAATLYCGDAPYRVLVRMPSRRRSVEEYMSLLRMVSGAQILSMKDAKGLPPPPACRRFVALHNNRTLLVGVLGDFLVCQGKLVCVGPRKGPATAPLIAFSLSMAVLLVLMIVGVDRAPQHSMAVTAVSFALGQFFLIVDFLLADLRERRVEDSRLIFDPSSRSCMVCERGKSEVHPLREPYFKSWDPPEQDDVDHVSAIGTDGRGWFFGAVPWDAGVHARRAAEALQIFFERAEET